MSEKIDLIFTAMEKMKDQLDFQKKVAKISSLFVGDYKFIDSIHNSLEEFGKFCNAGRAVLITINSDFQMNCLAEWYKIGEEPIFKKINNIQLQEKSKTIMRLKQGKMINLAELKTLSNEKHSFYNFIKSKGIHSLIIAPIIVNTKLIGVIGCSKKDLENNYKKSEKTLLRVLKDIIANTFKRKQTEEELIKERTLLHNVIQLNPYGIVIFETDGHVRSVNQAFLRMIRHQIGDSYSLFKDPFIKKMNLLETINRVKNGEIVQLKELVFDLSEYKVPNLNQVFIIQPVMFPIFGSNNELDSLVLVIEDITEQKHAEELLRESEMKYRTLVETTNDLIFRLDPMGSIDFINQAFTQFLGYSLEEVREQDFSELVLPEDRWLIHQSNRRLLKGYSIKGMEYRVKSKNGDILYFSANMHPFLNFEGKITAIYGIARDISGKINAQKAIKESELKYRNVVETSSDFIFILNLNGKYSFVNNASTSILGYTSEELLSMNGFSQIKNEDLIILEEIIKKLNQGNSVSNVELRFRQKNGQYIELSTNISPIFNTQGKVVSLLGIGRDLSELKTKERQIHEKELQIQSSAVISMISSMLVHDTARVKDSFNGILKTLGNSISSNLILLLKHNFENEDYPFKIEGTWLNFKYQKDLQELDDLISMGFLRPFVENVPSSIYKILKIENLPEDIRKKCKNFGFGTLLLLPIFYGSKRYGTVILNNPIEKEFSSKEIKLCLNVALLMGLGLKNQDNQLFTSNIFDGLSTLNIGLFVLSQYNKEDFKILYVSSYITKIFEKTEDEMINSMTLKDLIPNDDFKNLIKINKMRVIDKSIPKMYQVHIKVKNKIINDVVGISPGIFNGKPVIYGILIDKLKDNLPSASEIVKRKI
ncbi:MAG: PAS domain S-box protein [Promethearchaeota archaeon]